MKTLRSITSDAITRYSHWTLNRTVLKTFNGDLVSRCLNACLSNTGLFRGEQIAIESKAKDLLARLMEHASDDPIEALLVGRVVVTYVDSLVRDEAALSTPETKLSRKPKEQLRDQAARRFDMAVRSLQAYRAKPTPAVQVNVRIPGPAEGPFASLDVD